MKKNQVEGFAPEGDDVEKSMMGDTFDSGQFVKVERWRFSVENTTDHLDKAPTSIMYWRPKHVRASRLISP